MEAYARSLDIVLSEKQQWVVPVYQRHYEWETADNGQIPKFWQDLRDQAEETLDGRLAFPHYFGAVLFSEPSSQPFGAVRKRYLVDGQQRITTFTLALIAIREVARDLGVARTQEVVEAYLFNEISKGMLDPGREHHKLWPSAYDRALYLDIVGNNRADIHKSQPDYFFKNGKLIKSKAPNLLKAYWALYEYISEFIKERSTDFGGAPEDTLDALVSGLLSGLQVVMIHLDEKDDAQEIFASLNGLAKPLSPFDLIRNDIFHRARKQGEDDEKLFDERWKEFEQPFWNTYVRQGRFSRARADHLIAHAVVAETGREVNAGKIAVEYQHYAKERAFDSVAKEIDVLLRHARTYRGMEELSSPATKRLTTVLRDWDLSTLHPVVLWVMAYGGHEEDMRPILDVIETYIVRREICGLTTKNYNKVAIFMIKALKGSGCSSEDFVRALVGLAGDASRMPSDDEVVEASMIRPIYAATPARRLRYILENLEYKIRARFDETVNTSNLTIEHVMPRRWAEHWPLPSGDSVPTESAIQAISAGLNLEESTRQEMDRRQQLVNTLGNLTLVTESLNPSLSNGPWANKRERLKQSLLVLNRQVASKDCWDEEGIKARGAELGQLATRVWPIGAE